MVHADSEDGHITVGRVCERMRLSSHRVNGVCEGCVQAETPQLCK